MAKIAAQTMARPGKVVRAIQRGVTGALAIGMLLQQAKAKPNFYLPENRAEKPATSNTSTRQQDTPAKKSAPAATPAPSPKSSDASTKDKPEKKAEPEKKSESEKKAEPEKTAESRKNAEPEKKSESEKKSPAGSAVDAGDKIPALENSALGDLDLKKRPAAPSKPFEPAVDPYDLAKRFQTRWDFSHFLVTSQEELQYRLEAARRRTLRLARALSALSTEVEARQRNLNAAALAAYLLGRDQATWMPLGGRSLTEPQMIAVRATMSHDIRAMHAALGDYDVLRESLNRSATDVAQMEARGLSAAEPNALAYEDRPTLPLPMVAEAQTTSVLAERVLSLEALKAVLASEALSQDTDRRQSIASFAPPPPEANTETANAQNPPATAAISSFNPGFAPLPLKGSGLKRQEKPIFLLPTGINAPVRAVKNGVVVYAGPFRGYGNMVIIEHEKGTFSVYSYLETVEVKERQAVADGAILGRAGTPPALGQTGISLQVRRGAEILDPEQWAAGEDLRKKLAGR